MLYFIVKIFLSAGLIALISEIAKKSSLMGSIFASIPLTSLLAMIWLYQETKDENQIIDLSYNIFWLVLPSLSFFIIFPFLLKLKLDFYLAILISLAIMVALYFVMIYLLEKFGYKI